MKKCLFLCKDVSLLPISAVSEVRNTLKSARLLSWLKKYVDQMLDAV